MRGVEQVPWLYDLICGLSDRLGLARWRAWLAGGIAGRTLEVGCGTGRNLPYYPAAARVFGLEPDRAVLARARRRAPGVPLVVGDVQALPFRDGAFQTVVSGLVFCTVPDPERGLAEIHRVLRPDGSLRMIEHVRADGLMGRLQDAVQPAWTWCAGGCHPNRRTEDTVRRAGFQIETASRRARRGMRRFVARPKLP